MTEEMAMTDQAELIKIDDVVKTYRLGEVHVKALQGVSLSVKRGDFIIITGRNGSGKSTLLYQMGLLDRPDSGHIYFEGRDVVGRSDKHRRFLRLTFLGYIFQNFALISELTSLENVMLPAMMLEKPNSCMARAKDLLDKVGLGHRINHLTRQLSGGEQQKVAIARALINNPKVIIADEPTSNLDSIAAQDILAIFQRLNQEDGHAIVMVTHEQDDVRYSSEEIKLSDGRRVK
jgi:putative ABC transport system ATP-binding protein